jgi:hypothetical protein
VTTPHHSLHHVDRAVRQVLPDVPGNRRLLRFLPLAIFGALLCANCHLDRIAAAFGGNAKSSLQRLRRWIGRDSFRVAPLLPRFAAALIAAQTGPVRLLVDRTEWKHANLLYAAVSFRGRAVPVAVMILSGPKATNADELAALLCRAAEAIGPGREVIVMGDREFGNVLAIGAIAHRGWHFCLRFKQDTWFRDAAGESWRAKDRWPAPGGAVQWPEVQVTLRRHGPLNACVIWHRGEKEPWVLVSDLPCPQLGRLYASRMRIEEMFSDLKGRGFRLEASRLRCPRRLERLAALISIAYLWLVATACAGVRRGLRRQVDPSTRRGLSYPQIALRLLQSSPPETANTLLNAAAKALGAK